MYIAILGRQPELSLAELEAIYGEINVKKINDGVATIESDSFNFELLSGSKKAGEVKEFFANSNWRQVNQSVIDYYYQKWLSYDKKITLGISAYGFDKLTTKDIQYVGVSIKKLLKKQSVNVRLIPNAEVSLNTASSHHNKLGLSENKVEIFIIKSGKDIILAESLGSQNITALASRDQARPRTDAFVGMLPPKLAKIMINLTGLKSPGNILDPFCGTGTVLQEALLLGYSCQGTDLSQKMIDYSSENLDWISKKYSINPQNWKLATGDAMKHKWTQPIDAVVCETYLGQPFSAPPSSDKLSSVSKNCQYIVDEFLTNISAQIKSGTPLVVAIPAWKKKDGSLHRLNIKPTKYGLKIRNKNDLIYHRDDQIVARDIFILDKA